MLDGQASRARDRSARCAACSRRTRSAGSCLRKLKVYAGPEPSARGPAAGGDPPCLRSRAVPRPRLPAVIVATGKRKTSVARVRMKLGTGQILVNGRTLEEYFPREALADRRAPAVRRRERRAAPTTSLANISRRRHRRPGRRAAPRHRARAREDRPGPASRAQARRLPDARRAQEGAQEVRPARRARALPVLEAVGGPGDG